MSALNLSPLTQSQKPSGVTFTCPVLPGKVGCDTAVPSCRYTLPADTTISWLPLGTMSTAECPASSPTSPSSVVTPPEEISYSFEPPTANSLLSPDHMPRTGEVGSVANTCVPGVPSSTVLFTPVPDSICSTNRLTAS